MNLSRKGYITPACADLILEACDTIEAQITDQAVIDSIRRIRPKIFGVKAGGLTPRKNAYALAMRLQKETEYPIADATQREKLNHIVNSTLDKIRKLSGNAESQASVVAAEAEGIPERGLPLDTPEIIVLDSEHKIVCGCTKFAKSLWEAKVAGHSSANVVIAGPSGTGKELIARLIRQTDTKRSSMPFIAVNCATLSQQLGGDDLFGHVRGAFTGADKDRKGCFDAANNGILFLDEIHELPIEIQGALLRVLQERELTRIGDRERSVQVDVRVIAASSEDLDKRMAAGKFLEALYHRLAVLRVEVPALRLRGDVPLLAESALEDANKRNKTAVTISAKAIEALIANPMPGNIRQLQNVIEHARAWATAMDLNEISPEIVSSVLNRTDYLRMAKRIVN